MKYKRNTRITRKFTAIAAGLALGLVVGCGDDEEELETPETCSQELQTCEAEVFLSVEEFEFLRQEDAVTIFDSRRDVDDYEAGHIPGALFADWGVLRDEDGILYDDDELLEDSLEDLGVDQDDTIIVYGAGDGSGGDSVAGNFYWTLEYLGHDEVYLLNGGLTSWIDAEVEGLDTGHTEPDSGDFTVERRDEMTAPFDEVHDAIDDDEVVLADTRRFEEWTGENERNNPRGGHIPEAVHYHWEDALDDDAELRPDEDLLGEFSEIGLEEGSDVIAYCQSGVRSGFFYAILKELEFPQPKNYDGSWYEWSREADEDDIVVPE